MRSEVDEVELRGVPVLYVDTVVEIELVPVV